MTATIKQNHPQYSFWFQILGTDEVEVLEPSRNPLEQVNCARPGAPWKKLEPGKFYQLDVASLSAIQRQRLVVQCSHDWKQPVRVVEKWISDRRNGIPLLASDLFVAMRLF